MGWNTTEANLMVTIETSRKSKYTWYFNILLHGLQDLPLWPVFAKAI